MKDVDTVENTVKAGDFVKRTKGTKAVTADEANVLVEKLNDEMCLHRTWK